MQANRILFPIDFSKSNHAALSYATSIARDSGAKLIIVHVAESPTAYAGGEMYYGVPEPNEKAIEDMLRAMVPADPAVAFEHRLLSGDPATEIVHLAEQDHVDLIVMSTHGRTGFNRLIMGSVAEAVVRNAKCPVLTFKFPSAAIVEEMEATTSGAGAK